MPHVMLTPELVDYIEDRNGKGIEGKAWMRDLWEVPVDSETYELVRKARRPDESWSETIMRLVREADRLAAVGNSE